MEDGDVKAAFEVIRDGASYMNYEFPSEDLEGFSRGVGEAADLLEKVITAQAAVISAELTHLNPPPGAFLLLRCHDHLPPDVVGRLSDVITDGLIVAGMDSDGRPNIMVLGSFAKLETLTDQQLLQINLQRVPFKTHFSLMASGVDDRGSMWQRLKARLSRWSILMFQR